MEQKILVVAAHPDDEVLGMGGTLLKFAKEKSTKIHILFLSDGEASRGEREANDRLRRSQARQVAKKLGAEIFQSENFPDNSFDSVPLLKIIQTIESYLEKINPTIIFTHHGQDLNVDHRLTFQAVYTACRPSSHRNITKLYSFEILSSTEWQAKTSSNVFLPSVYINIEDFIDEKISLLQLYSREVSPYPFPRSRRGVLTLAQFRGMESGFKYAEAFQLIRGICR